MATLFILMIGAVAITFYLVREMEKKPTNKNKDKTD
jgi:hypothetical protein